MPYSQTPDHPLESNPDVEIIIVEHHPSVERLEACGLAVTRTALVKPPEFNESLPAVDESHEQPSEIYIG